MNGLSVVQDLDRDSVTYCHILFGQPTPGQLVASLEDGVAIRDRLAKRAERLGYVRASPGAVPDRRVRLIIDGNPVDPVEIYGNRRTFVVPSGHQVVQLASPDDAEILQIETISTRRYEVIPADHPDLVVGWGPCERDAKVRWRRVLDVAQLPLGHVAESAKLVVHLKM